MSRDVPKVADNNITAIANGVTLAALVTAAINIEGAHSNEARTLSAINTSRMRDTRRKVRQPARTAINTSGAAISSAPGHNGNRPASNAR